MTLQCVVALGRGARVLLLLWLISTPLAAATYFKIEANGQGVGYARSERSTDATKIVREEILRLRISRDQQIIDITAKERTEESRNGTPLAFSSSTQFSGYQSSNSGRLLTPLVLEVTQKNPGFVDTRKVALTPTTLFPDAIERKLRASAFKTGAVLEFDTFLSDAARLASLRYEVLGPAHFGGKPAFRVRSTLQIRADQISEVSELLYSPAGELLQQSLDLLGTQLVLSRSSRRDAKAALSAGAWNILDAALLVSPIAQPLATRFRARTIELQNDDAAAQFGSLNSAEQSVTSNGAGRWLFTVTAAAQHAEPAPAAQYLRANAWIQSDDARLHKLANEALDEITATPAAQMVVLERFVGAFIETKDMSQGYASALEAARSRRGDCTEHALLLAALGRTQGIPTRVAAGFAYAEQFAGRSNVFVPHAWTQAYVDGHWRSFDAALGRFDTRRIALSFGNGEPWDFAGAMSARGAMKIEQVRIENN